MMSHRCLRFTGIAAIILLIVYVLVNHSNSPVFLAFENIPTIETALGFKTYIDLERDVYFPLGYRMQNMTMIPSLEYIVPLDCPKVFSEWLKISENNTVTGPPPRDIPKELLNAYTLNGYVHLIVEGYLDDRTANRKTIWTKEYINLAISRDPKLWIESYGGNEASVYYAMKDFGVSGKTGAIIGSQTPWVEAFALKLGAKHITTMEYMQIDIPNDDRMEYMHPIQVAKESSKHIGVYDFITSYSSIEHSGLGRYGDALDPMADLTEAKKLHCFLKSDGLLFIGLQFGWDTVHWNRHRIFGRIRLAMFAAGYDILKVFDRDGERILDKELFEKGPDLKKYNESTLVLKKR